MTIQEIKKLIEQLNEFQAEENCEMNTISLNYELEKIGIKNEIVSGDLKIKTDTGEHLEFIQGLNRSPIGHSWIAAEINGEFYIVEGSYMGNFHQGCLIEKVANPKGQNIFKANNRTYDYLYRNDGNNHT